MYEDVDAARGARIAAMRGDRLMTQSAMAVAAGLHVGTVRRAEAGKPLSAETAQALCAVFGIPPDGLSAPDVAVTSEAALTGDSQGRRGPTGTTPRVVGPEWLTCAKWSGFAVAVLSVVAAVILEWASWRGVDPLWFRLLQAVTQTCLANALCILFVNRLAATRRMAWALPLVVSVCACAWPSVQVRASLDQTALDVMHGLKNYGREHGVIKVRTIVDPAWDPSEAKWRMTRQLMSTLGNTTAYMETPGTYASHERRGRECRELFLHADAYPKDACDPPRQPLDEPTYRQLWKSVVGGSFVPDEYATMTPDEVIGGEDFAPSRAVYDEVTPLVANGMPPGTRYEDRVREVARALADGRGGNRSSAPR